MNARELRDSQGLGEWDKGAARAIAEGTHGDPFGWLGPHADNQGGTLIRAFLPGAREVEAVGRDGKRLALLEPQSVEGIFIGRVADDDAAKTGGAGRAPVHPRYLLRIQWPGGVVQETEDPYAFGALLGELDLHLFAEGRHFEIGGVLGAQPVTADGVLGVRFVVWAPNARRVSVVGGFNGWDARRHPMRMRHGTGLWEIFLPRLQPGEVYKYAILGAQGELPLKADPVALRTELPPATGSVVSEPLAVRWQDEAWMRERAERHAPGAPISVYEVHPASWRHRDGRSLDWDGLAEQLVPYVVDMGFTHIELMPIMEHPFGGSWGYQPLSQFAPSARFGTPQQFARFVDACHRAGVGVILDWVPAHFPTDEHGLARFDGTALYEHGDPREGFHRDWNTLIYNVGRREVQGFLIASGLHWLEQFHADGLRVDAVASMLYRDYSRNAGEWVPNVHGGRENLESVQFLQHLNAVVGERVPGAMTIAEESTAWPGVTRATTTGGLGFTYKWNMGWMHDSLRYFAQDPMHRRWHHDDLSFSLVYAFSERYVLPISHDEVVHGKGSMIGKMPGDEWQRFANLRAFYGFMWTHPGKKLLFMGGEIAQVREWNHDRELDWHLLGDGLHAGVQALVRDLNKAYRSERALHAADTEPGGFRWVIGDDRDNSVYAYLREAGDADPVLVVCNLTPQVLHDYRIGVPRPGRWRELLNTDAGLYGGSNVGNMGAVPTQAVAAHGSSDSLVLTLPPLATLILRPDAGTR